MKTNRNRETQKINQSKAASRFGMQGVKIVNKYIGNLTN